MSSLLVQQNPHSFPWLHPAPDNSHQLGFDEVFALLHLAPGGCQGGQGAAGASPDVHTPVGVDVLGVVNLAVRLVGRTHVALTWKEETPALFKGVCSHFVNLKSK